MNTGPLGPDWNNNIIQAKLAPQLEERLERIERVLLGFMALISGEARAVSRSPEDLETLQAELAKDCEQIRDSWR